MKRFKLINLLTIIILTISLMLTGCRSKDKDEDVSTKIEQEEEIGKVEMEEEMDLETEDEPPLVEESEEKSEEAIKGNEEVKVTKDTKETKDRKGQTTQNTEKPQETKSVENNTLEENTHILKIEGNVGKELRLSLKDLKAMNDIIFQDDFYSINNFGTTAHTNFKGVNLWRLLEKAQISSGANTVSIIATDGYMMEFTVEQVKKQDYIDETNPNKKFPMIIAWAENGVEYDSNEGPPFKLVVGQKEPGDVNKPQWVSNIDRIVVK